MFSEDFSDLISKDNTQAFGAVFGYIVSFFGDLFYRHPTPVLGIGSLFPTTTIIYIFYIYVPLSVVKKLSCQTTTGGKNKNNSSRE